MTEENAYQHKESDIKDTIEELGDANQTQPTDWTVEEDVSQPEEINQRHGDHVRQLAVVLFERTKPLHELGEDRRQILEAAPYLYNLPLPQRKKKPYKDAKVLVRENIEGDFTPEQVNELAAIIALQQGALKRKDISNLDLSPIQQRDTLTIGALLNIAIGLDASNSQETNILHIESSRSGIWIVVEGPEAIADAAEAQGNSRLWTKIGYPEIKIMESTKAETKLVPFPEPMERPGVEGSDPLAEAGRKVMRYQFAEVLRHEEGTRLGEDIEALHDMRVATRRLRAAFEVFKYAYKPGALKPHLRGLRATGRALGGVRDLDVFMEKVGKYLDSQSEDQQDALDPLIESWNQQRESARNKMLVYLDSEEYSNFKRKFNVFLKTPGAGTSKGPKDIPSPNLVSELAPVLIYQRLGAVRSYDPFLEEAPLELLHALRIEFKKLRYTVEYFREVLGQEAKTVIDDLKKMQDHLGDLNDANVAVQSLGDFIESWEVEQARLPESEGENIDGVAAYLTYQQAELVRLRDTFPEAWAYFNRPEFRQNLASSISVL